MQLVTIEEVRDHCRADSADDVLLTLYAEAAEQAAQDFLNRRVYVDDGALAVARDEVTAMLEAADAAYDTAVEAAGDLSGSARAEAMEFAGAARREVANAAREINRGIVATPPVRAAILLIAGHLYRNREQVMTGQGAAAVELPMGARSLLWPNRVGLGV